MSALRQRLDQATTPAARQPILDKIVAAHRRWRLGDPEGARADLADADLARADLAGADLAGANLADANLADADLAGANLAGANLARAYLADAYLAGADLARAYLARAYLADANLARANLAGADLAGADLADADLADANLAGAYLARAYLARAYLARAYLARAYLADANLAGANLADADLAGANLAGANLAGAIGIPRETPLKDPPEPYQRRAPGPVALGERARRYRELHPEVPVVEQLDSRILDAITTGGGQLDMGAWHTCETTHCRAGWAIVLAGKPGKDLERQHGPAVAGRMIYRASTGHSPHFFAPTDRALADIRRCAEEEAQAAQVTP